MAISGTEFQLISRFLKPVALEYLRTGKYETVTTLDGDSLTPNERRILDAFKGDPAAVSAAALSSVVQAGYTADDLEQALESIRSQRRGQEGDVARMAEQAAVPSPDRPPLGPLPGGQEYRFDYSRNTWMVVEGGTRFVSDVDQSGERQPQPAGQEIPSGSTVTEDELGRPTVGLGFGRGQRTYDYGDPELAALGGGVAEGIAAVSPAVQLSPGMAEEPAATPEVELPQDWEQAAAEQYGGYWQIFQYNPELKKLLLDATQQEWAPDKFRYQLEQTNWWKTTTESARLFDMEEATDPATVQTKIDNQAAQIRQTALTLNVRLSDETAAQLARDSLRGAWTPQLLSSAIGAEAMKSTAGVSQLRAGWIGQTIRETANNYGIAISDTTFNQWVNKIAVGQETQTTWEDYAKVQAKNMFPSIADRIDAGQTFQDIVDPYRENAARLLEIDGADIDFTQSEWVKAITYQDDKGQQRPMSFTEWNDYIRQTRSFGYEYTEQAQQRAYQVADRLANLFGKV